MQMDARSLPYLSLLRHAVLLGIAPAAFWQMTPREIAAVLGESMQRPSPPSRRMLEALMQRWPDTLIEKTAKEAGRTKFHDGDEKRNLK